MVSSILWHRSTLREVFILTLHQLPGPSREVPRAATGILPFDELVRKCAAQDVECRHHVCVRFPSPPGGKCWSSDVNNEPRGRSLGTACGLHDMALLEGDQLRQRSRTSGSPLAPGWCFHIRREAGINFCGIERCSGFGCRKRYRLALLVAYLRHAAR
jgi:hypothetical protein